MKIGCQHPDDHDRDADAGTYADRTRERDDAYRRAYREWIASLPPGERERMNELGLDRPSVPGAGTGAPSRDMAESSAASCEPDEAEWDGDSGEIPDTGGTAEDTGDDSDEEPLAPASVPETLPGTVLEPDSERFHDLLRRLVGERIGQDNARLSLECLALVTGLAYCGDSMTDIARRHGVTRAAVSKRCVELTRALNLKPSRAMRSVESRQSYRRARMRHLQTQV